MKNPSLAAFALVPLLACGPRAEERAAQETVSAPTLPTDQRAELDALLAEMESAQGMTSAAFMERHPATFVQQLGYDPASAANLDLIQASPEALDAAELQTLAQQGFVISTRQTFPTFMYGYGALYRDDLPLYVSADSLLYALHRSYDGILKAAELASFIPDVRSLLMRMRNALVTGGTGHAEDVVKDMDMYLAVALSLLDGTPAAPVAGGDTGQVRDLVAMAEAHEGVREVTLFGRLREEDFSQFKPRGHYTDSVELERYFRAMMWLGRVDFRMVEPQQDKLRVNRREILGALLSFELLDAPAMARWERLDAALQVFVGERDSMGLDQVPRLMQALGITRGAEAEGLSADVLAEAIIAGGFGTQRIASHVMQGGLAHARLPLHASFLLMGQRYILDSHVFSNLVFDRLNVDGFPKRMMPDPLDVAFAALDNNQAGHLLAAQLDTYGYAGNLHGMRVLVDAHKPETWEASLYSRWLDTLRALSPAPEGNPLLPTVARTDAWGRRMLNTQLASWAELRHDTLLYAKQSYTGGSTCSFPDAYVDPYPRFYQRLAALAEHGAAVADVLVAGEQGTLAQSIRDLFHRQRNAAVMLGQMAQQQLDGVPFTAEQMAFINDAVVLHGGCAGVEWSSGWYSGLFFHDTDALKWDPTIADVHTQPTDEGGSPVGRVLHVGTGHARLAVVTVETCQGPRAYAGLVSSYHQRVTENFQRMTDEEWAADFIGGTPAEVSWMAPLLAR